MDYYSKHLKRKMIKVRLAGIFACLIGIAGIVLRFLELVPPWLCIISSAYAMALIFSFNGSLQGIRGGNPWARVNVFCALLMFAFVIFLIVYGFMTGELKTQL